MKHYLLITLFCGIANFSAAQKTTPGGLYFPSQPSENEDAMIVPKEFSYSNKPLLTFRNRKSRNQVMIYDENIDLIKSFDINDNNQFNYTLKYQTEERDITKVTEKDKSQENLGISFQKWFSSNQMMDPSLTMEALNVSKVENGDSIISVDYSKTHSYTSNEEMYFGYSYFEMKYPKIYWICSKGNMFQCRTNYSVTYSDWKTTSTTTESFSERLPHIYLYNLNLDNGDGTNGTYFDVSQTLFNQDEDFEYIIPKLALVKESGEDADGTTIITPSTEETIETTHSSVISEKSQVAAVGFQVVSSNGEILKDLNFDNGFSFNYRYYATRIALITIGGNRYLTFSNGSSTIFYKIDSQTSSIKMVKETPSSMFISPSVVDKNTIINVSLGDNNERGSEIVIVSMSGSKVNSKNIPSGQKQVQLSANMPTGIYCVSRLQNGKVNETKKIIVK